ncbi:MAG: hypothetical protein E7591_06205 [Ruminococcaceae bacterium]|nr:hypothetical protein [Oscillospiraceae bacterium]
MERNKKKQDACDYSKDEFLTNPVASVNDVTGYVQRIPDVWERAQSIADISNVPVDSLDKKGAVGKKLVCDDSEVIDKEK